MPIEDESISDPGGIIQPGTVYGWSDMYFGTSVINPGEGYWIRANADGDVTLYYIPSVQV